MRYHARRVTLALMDMDMEPSGPEVIIGQLQFEFDGIPSLTLEQRLSIWLKKQDEETPEVYAALLLLADNDSRARRSRRWEEVRAIQAPYDSPSGWLLSGGVEVSWLYDEACRDYINGAYFSALLCAHAACERELAGFLFPYKEELPNGWLWWGLGKLIPQAANRGLIDDQLRDDLSKLTETRKVSAHYKVAHETENSVQRRALSLLSIHSDLEDEAAIDSIARSDAIFSIQVATTIVRSNLGFQTPWT